VGKERIIYSYAEYSIVDGKDHVGGYALIATILTAILYYFGYADSFVMGGGLLLGAFYALLPDIDHPISYARKGSLIAGLFLIAATFGGYYLFRDDRLLLGGAVVCGILLGLILLTHHRGIFHTVYMGTALAAPWLYFSTTLFGYALLGYFTHLLFDSPRFHIK
jgi:hypothetical protein